MSQIITKACLDQGYKLTKMLIKTIKGVIGYDMHFYKLCLQFHIQPPYNAKNPPSVFFYLLKSLPFLKSSHSQLLVRVTTHRQFLNKFTWCYKITKTNIKTIYIKKWQKQQKKSTLYLKLTLRKYSPQFPFSRSLRVTSDDRRIGISPERPIHFECN